MSEELRAVLDDVAGEILDRDSSADADTEREELLRGAALLTGRADVAQDATHIGMVRAHLEPDEESARRRVRTEVVRAARCVPPTV